MKWKEHVIDKGSLVLYTSSSHDISFSNRINYGRLRESSDFQFLSYAAQVLDFQSKSKNKLFENHPSKNQIRLCSCCWIVPFP